MKNINIEKAESSPTKLGMGRRLTNKNHVIDFGYGRYRHHHLSDNWLQRFLNSNIGQDYNKTYNKLLSKLNKTRIYKSGYHRDCILDNFKRLFRPPRYGRFYKDPLFPKYIIDNNGCIQKGYTYERHRNKEIVLDTIYKLKPELNHIIVRIFGIKVLRELQEGVNEAVLQNLDKNSSLQEFLNWNYRHYGKVKCMRMFNACKTVCPEDASHAFKKKCTAELLNQKRKQLRESEKQKEEYWDNVVFPQQYKEGGTAAKRRRIEEQKRIEALENITRDRLGFDETSFKTPQKMSA